MANPHRVLVGALALVPLVVAAPGCGGEDASVEIPPNVIVISLDTLRRDHVGFHGYERDTTPFLDEYARQCLVFDRAYTTASWTLIAHMSLLTGLYPSQHEVWEAEAALTTSFPTLAQRLQAEGYQTLGVHFPGWLDPRFGFDRGHHFYASAEDAEEAGERIEDALERRNEERPFYLFVHLFDIHSAPLHVADATMYDPPPPFDELFVEGAKERLRGLDVVKAWEDSAEEVTPAQHEAIVALYDGGIRYVDDKLRDWFDEWERDGLLDDTLVVITSDHGEGLNQRGDDYGGHGGNFEEGLHVPLLVRLPDGGRAGERVPHVVSHVDVVPTVLEVVGLEPDDRLPGHSLLGPRPSDEFVLAQRPRTQVAYRGADKLWFNPEGPIRLSDVVEDPEERDSVRPHPDRMVFHAATAPLYRELLAQLAEHHDPGDALDAGSLSEGSKDKLRGLGYADVVDD